MIAKLVAIHGAGHGEVASLEGASAPLAVRTVVPLSAKLLGAEVLLLLSSRPALPVIVGLLQPVDAPAQRPLVRKQRLRLVAKKELVLQCGQARLSLTADGKVTLEGADVLQTSTGQYRIHGASVRIN